MRVPFNATPPYNLPDVAVIAITVRMLWPYLSTPSYFSRTKVLTYILHKQNRVT